MISLWVYIVLLLILFVLPFLSLKTKLKTTLFAICMFLITFIMYVMGFISNENLSNVQVALRLLNGLVGGLYGVFLSRKYDITKVDQGLRVILLSGFGVVIGSMLLVVSGFYLLVSTFMQKQTPGNTGDDK